MMLTDVVLLLLAGLISGALNAIVGGGAFVAFPALIFLGIPPISANATMTVSLWPGTLASLWAQRRELFLHTKMLPVFIPFSLLGGGLGAIILIHMSNTHFASIVPYILMMATILFSFRQQLINWVRKFPSRKDNTIVYWILIAVTQLLISIYGGFFGAGMGIIFLAFLGIIGMHNMHEANAVRNCSAACINSVASIVFIVSGKVMWPQMMLMCTGAIIGGYFCAHYVRRFPSEWLRKAVILTAWGMTAYFFWKQIYQV